jgi:hypothetical protein
MRRIVLLVLVPFLLTACPNSPVRLDFNTDPRILRGKWMGEVLPTSKMYGLGVLSADGRTLYALQGDALVRLNPDSGEELDRRELGVLPTHDTVKIYPDGEVWAYGRNSGLQIVCPDGTVLPPWQIQVKAISADRSRVLAMVSETRYTAFEVNTGQPLREVSLPQDFSFDMFGNRPPSIDAVSPDLQLLASSKVLRDGLSVKAEVNLYDLDLRPLQTWVIGRGWFEAAPFSHPELSFSPDGSHLVGLMPDGRVFFWRLSDGAVLSFPDYPDRSYRLVAESPDGLSRVFLKNPNYVGRGEDDFETSSYEVVWWEAGRGVWARQTVRDVWYERYAHAVGNQSQVWLSSTSGLMISLEPNGVRWRKEPTLLPLRLELTPTYRDEKSYTFVGTAKLGGTNYSVTGKGFLPFGGVITQAPPPAYMAFTASLENSSGEPRYLAGQIQLSVSAPMPTYPILLSSQPFSDRFLWDRDAELDGQGLLRRAARSH